jgi:hypothetical protein
MTVSEEMAQIRRERWQLCDALYEWQEQCTRRYGYDTSTNRRIKFILDAYETSARARLGQ